MSCEPPTITCPTDEFTPLVLEPGDPNPELSADHSTLLFWGKTACVLIIPMHTISTVSDDTDLIPMAVYPFESAFEAVG